MYEGRKRVDSVGYPESCIAVKEERERFWAENKRKWDEWVGYNETASNATSNEKKAKSGGIDIYEKKRE